jgi:hypothetical protein
MRITAPAIGGSAIALAVALVWLFRPELDRPSSVAGEDAAAPVPAERGSMPAARRTPSAEVPPPMPARAVEGRITESAANPPPIAEVAPLPGQPPATPMAQMLAEREREFPPEIAEGERQFAAEPVDSTWAPGAEAEVLSKFAQMPGLKLIDLQVECRSTMCRLQLAQPTGAPEAGDGRPFNILLDSIGYKPRWMMAIRDPSGAMRSIAYLWRDGFAPERSTDEPQEQR